MIAFSPPASGAPATEKQFLLDVCEKGPAAAFARATRANGDALQTASRVLPNPTLSVEHQQGVTQVKGSETIVGISVPLGIGGRKFLLEDAADAWRQASKLDANGALLDAALDARLALVHVVADEAQLAVLKNAQTELEGVTNDMGDLAKGGEVSKFELLRQRSAVRAHANEVARVEANVAGSKRRLDTWAVTPVVTHDLRLDELARGRARDGAAHPKLGALDAGLSATRTEATAARRKWVPDIEVFAGYRGVTAPGLGVGHGFSLAVKIPITFFDHGQGDEALAEANGARLRAEREAFVRRQEANLRAATDVEATLAAQRIETSAAVADAAELDRQARVLYKAGESSLSELLAALSAAESVERVEIELEEELAVARVEAMRARGSLFDPALDRACGASAR